MYYTPPVENGAIFWHRLHAVDMISLLLYGTGANSGLAAKWWKHLNHDVTHDNGHWTILSKFIQGATLYPEISVSGMCAHLMSRKPGTPRFDAEIRITDVPDHDTGPPSHYISRFLAALRGRLMRFGMIISDNIKIVEARGGEMLTKTLEKRGAVAAIVLFNEMHAIDDTTTVYPGDLILYN